MSDAAKIAAVAHSLAQSMDEAQREADEYHDQFHGLGEYHDAGPLNPSRQHLSQRKCVNASRGDADAAASPPTDAATSGAGGTPSTLDLLNQALELTKQAHDQLPGHEWQALSSIYRARTQLIKATTDVKESRA